VVDAVRVLRGMLGHRGVPPSVRPYPGGRRKPLGSRLTVE
jgi:hypothetical protein